MSINEAAWTLMVLTAAASIAFGIWRKDFWAGIFMAAILFFATALSAISIRSAMHKFTDYQTEKK